MNNSVNFLDLQGNFVPEKIAVVRALKGLGDLLCIVPALRTLRRNFPDAEITLIGLPQAKFFAERFSCYIDNLLEFPGWPGLPERKPELRQLPAFLKNAQEAQFDLALQMHGSGLILNPVTFMLDASYTAGFYPPGQPCHDIAYFLEYNENEPEIMRYLRLLDFLGLPTYGNELEFPVYWADHEKLFQLFQTHNLRSGEYICIHPGASSPEKCWRPERFAAIADSLAAEGLQIVITGSATEVTLAQQVGQKMRANFINLAGCTPLGVLAALLENSRLLVCNDTGVAHLASAVNTPSVVIFSNSNPARWAPLNQNRHRALIAQEDQSVRIEAVLSQAYDLLGLTDKSEFATIAEVRDSRRIFSASLPLVNKEQANYVA